MDSILGELGHKGPGGIPVWGYGVGLAAAVVGFEYFRTHSSGSSAAAGATGASAGADALPPDTSTTTTISDSNPPGWKPPWYWWMFIKPSQGQPVPHPKTNPQWEAQAHDWLISKGEAPGQVADALDDYLHHQKLGPEEVAMVEMAIRAWGEPPQGRPWHILRLGKPPPHTVDPGGPKKGPKGGTGKRPTGPVGPAPMPGGAF